MTGEPNQTQARAPSETVREITLAKGVFATASGCWRSEFLLDERPVKTYPPDFASLLVREVWPLALYQCSESESCYTPSMNTPPQAKSTTAVTRTDFDADVERSPYFASEQWATIETPLAS